MKQINFTGGFVLCSLLVGMIFPVGVSFAQTSPVTVKIATDKTSYVLGEPVVVIITAVSTSTRGLGFPSSKQTDYVIDDGKFRWSSDKAFTQAVTSVALEPSGIKEWRFTHTAAQYTLKTGTHTISGEVVGYGSATVSITVRPPAVSAQPVPRPLTPRSSTPRPPAVSAQPTSTVLVTSTTIQVRINALNVRQDAASSASKIGVVRRGEVLKKLGEKNNWVKVQLPGGQIGWVFGQYVASTKASAISTPRQKVIVTTRTLNVRSGAGVNTKVIATVQQNSVLEKVEEKGGWIKVILTNGQSGWVYGIFVK